jgi:uncharacterized protein (DUF4415 family)
MKSKPSAATSETKPAPRLRVGLKDVSREQFAVAARERLGKQRVSIMLDGEVIAFFRAKAGDRGYQTLINQSLHEAMAGERLEETLRRVIREEMRSA